MADRLLAHISSRRLEPGDPLPVERELVRLFAVGRSSVREALAGNLSRCTGYHAMVKAVVLAARTLRDGGRDGI